MVETLNPAAVAFRSLKKSRAAVVAAAIDKKEKEAQNRAQTATKHTSTYFRPKQAPQFIVDADELFDFSFRDYERVRVMLQQEIRNYCPKSSDKKGMQERGSRIVNHVVDQLYYVGECVRHLIELLRQYLLEDQYDYIMCWESLESMYSQTELARMRREADMPLCLTLRSTVLHNLIMLGQQEWGKLKQILSEAYDDVCLNDALLSAEDLRFVQQELIPRLVHRGFHLEVSARNFVFEHYEEARRQLEEARRLCAGLAYNLAHNIQWRQTPPEDCVIRRRLADFLLQVPQVLAELYHALCLYPYDNLEPHFARVILK